MKRFTILFVLVLMLLGLGCNAMQKHRQYVKDGLLVTGLNREAFLLEWGPPDKTSTLTGEEIMKAGWGVGVAGGRGFFFKGKQTYDFWIYEEKGVELVFLGLALVTWKTEKTVKQLRIETPPKPQSMGEHTEQKRKIPDKRGVPPIIFKDKVVIGILDFEIGGPWDIPPEHKKALIRELKRNARVEAVDIPESCGLSVLKKHGYATAEWYKDMYHLDMILYTYLTLPGRLDVTYPQVWRPDFSLINLSTKDVKEVSINIHGPLEQGFRGVSKKLLTIQDVNRILSAKKEAFGKKEQPIR